MCNTLLVNFHKLFEHTERAIRKKAKLFERTRIKYIKYSNHLNFLNECKNKNFIPDFIKIHKNFESRRANHILRKSENLILRALLAETRRKLFIIKDKTVKLQGELFVALGHDKFQQLETLISVSTMRISKQQKHRHDVILSEFNKKSKNEEIPKEKEADSNLVVNLSSVELTKEQISVLSRGLNFGIAPRRVPKFDIIKAIESATYRLEPEKLASFKAQIKQAIEKHKIKEGNLSDSEQEAINTLQKNKSILISKADKGNIVVIQDKKDYDEKMGKLVKSDEYELLKSDPTKSIENKVTSVLRDSGLDDVTRRNMTPRYSKPPHIYGLVKIHKVDKPLRPIVSCIDSPCQKLARYLLPILNPLTGSTSSFVLNSHNFIEHIKDLKIEENSTMGSFDVVNLFTTTPIHRTLERTRELLEKDETLCERTSHNVDNIMEMITVCVTNTYFQFNSDFYKQKKGMAMGSPLSPVLCNIFMEQLEEKAIATFQTKPLVWKRYVDDIFFIWPGDEHSVKTFHDHLNMQDQDINFTIELEVEGCLPFLDVEVIRVKDRITTRVYRKPTNSNLYLQYDSAHPKSVKNGIVNTLLHRAETHCSDIKSYNTEVELIEKVLVNNRYPRKLIRNIDRKRKQKKSTVDQEKEENKKPDALVVIPYVPDLSEKIIRLGARANIRVVCKSGDTLRTRLVKFKPRQETNKEVIYSIPCQCGKEYIGETGRPLTTRVKEHRAALKKGETATSKLVEHAWNTEHDFLWDKAKPIGRETRWKARKCHEALEIYMGGDNVISAPSMDVDPVWYTTLDELKKTRKKKESTAILRRSARIRDQQERKSTPLPPLPLTRRVLRSNSKAS
jgi:predicted GIY-YIG superfamily endonuclease/flagellar basal body rod protein FlgC